MGLCVLGLPGVLFNFCDISGLGGGMCSTECRSGYTARYSGAVIMRPSSLGGGRIMRRTLSVRLSVRPSRYGYRASRRAT